MKRILLLVFLFCILQLSANAQSASYRIYTRLTLPTTCSKTSSSTDEVVIFATTDHYICKDPLAVYPANWQFVGGGSGISGSGVANRVTFWNGINSLSSVSTFTFDGTNLSVLGGRVIATEFDSNTVNLANNGTFRFAKSDFIAWRNELNTGNILLTKDSSDRIASSGGFAGSLFGNASTVTNGIYNTDTGTVTNLMLAGSIANSKLSNSTISGVALGSNLFTLTIGISTFNGSANVTIPAYQTIQDEGSALTQRNIFNFIGSGVNCVDNSGSSRTDCTISPAAGTVTGTGTTNRLAKYTNGASAVIGDSLISDDGTHITLNGAANMLLKFPNFWLKSISGTYSAEFRNTSDNAYVKVGADMFVARRSDTSLAAAVSTSGVDIGSGGGNLMLNFRDTNVNGSLFASLYAPSSGLLELNSGTIGAYRDLKLRTLNATTSYQINGVTIYSVGAPSISGNGTLDTGSNDSAGKISINNTGASSVTVTFSITWTRAPACFVTNETTANLARATSTTTQVIFGGTTVTGDKFAYSCLGY